MSFTAPTRSSNHVFRVSIDRDLEQSGTHMIVAVWELKPEWVAYIGAYVARNAGRVEAVSFRLGTIV